MNQKVSRRVIARVIAEKLLAEPAKHDHWLKALAALLVESNMVEDAELISNDIAHEIFVQSGQLLVTVTSARPLDETLRTELTTYLRTHTGAREIVLDEHTDTNLLGGLVARTPDHELDASIRTQLKQLATIQ